MAEDKQDLGHAIPPEERAVVNHISDAVTAVAAGQETLVEDEAAVKGAALLFDFPHEGFISALAIMLIPREMKAKSRRIAAVAQPFGFVCNLSKREKIAVVTPAGYVTDFASIPRAVHWVISPFGKHAEAAVIHDWLYTMGRKGDAKSRRIADKAFVKALKLLEVAWFKRQIMYWSVRIGGAGGYGLPGDFTFRTLDTLTVIDPPPAREPFATTFALKRAEKKRAKPQI
jgi:hypothetical protein